MALKIDSVSVDGDGCLCIPTFRQDAEPTLSSDNLICFWVDTNDNNRTYLVFRESDGNQLKIELT